MIGGYREVWCIDFEFHAPNGERPKPICFVARELQTGRLERVWTFSCKGVELPFATSDDILFVAFYSSAEWGCFRSLGWPMPRRVLDLYVEYRLLRSGSTSGGGFGLLSALSAFGCPCIEAVEKSAMRDLAIRGGPYSPEEAVALTDYCQSDVDVLPILLRKMLPLIDVPRALLRGRYMVSVAEMEWNGIPIDKDTWCRVKELWPETRAQLIDKIDEDFGVYEQGVFKVAKFESWLIENDIPWPRLPSGVLALDDNTFRQMARSWPTVSPLRELRHILGKMRTLDLAVGSDGRNRTLLSPFSSKTGRNQPSTSRYIFGASVWLRGLIKPPEGHAIAYVDWSQQEFGIAAALSNDYAMREAYRTGDPYLAFAIQAGAASFDASKKSHVEVREQFKAAALAVQYGMGASSLAQSIGHSVARSRQLLRLHHETYPQFWKWLGAALGHGMAKSYLYSTFGWRISVNASTGIRTLMNFPMQANGAEMLRLACCLCTEGGIEVCAPVHDALLVTAPVDEIDDVVTEVQFNMCEASRTVLNGFKLRSDSEIIRYPDRFMDGRGRKMWDTILELSSTGSEEEKRR